jgi:hypothetical protein
LTLQDGTKKIGEYAFSFSNKLKSVTIPDGVTHIGKCAFWRCEELESVTIPGSIIYIGEDVFGGCDKLQMSIREKINEFLDIKSDIEKQEFQWSTDRERLNEQLETTANFSTESSVVTLTQEQLDNLLCYAVVAPQDYDTDKYDSYEAHNFDSVTSGIPDDVTVPAHVTDVVYEKLSNIDRALTQEEIDELIQYILKASAEESDE